jgi:hypothetical protein
MTENKVTVSASFSIDGDTFHAFIAAVNANGLNKNREAEKALEAHVKKIKKGG